MGRQDELKNKMARRVESPSHSNGTIVKQMTNSTDEDEFKYNWPGHPVIPPCVAGEFQSKNLKLLNRYGGELDRKTVRDAWWKHLDANPHPLFAGHGGVTHWTGCAWLAEGETAATRVLMELDSKWQDPATWEELRNIANADAIQMGGKPWKPARWFEVCREALRQLPMEDDEREAANEGWARQSWRLSRAASGKTTDAKWVEQVAGVSRDRAYKILRWGHGQHEMRVKLAAAFGDNPERNRPEHWELKNGSSWGGARPAFGDYCKKHLGPDSVFEYPALIRVRELLDNGALPYRPTLKALCDILQPVGTDNAELLDLWTAFKSWRG